MVTPENNPPFYFPPGNGKYEVNPGLNALTTDFGNGKIDRCFFQLDNQFHKYRNNKMNARDESLQKYVCLHDNNDLSPVIRFIIKTLANEYPGYYSFKPETNQLHCKLTGETLAFNKNHQLDDSNSLCKVSTRYINAFDALAMQIQEDIAVMKVGTQGQGEIIALHLCAPNYWAAQEKLGKDFVTVHKPVPGIERINQRANKINLACLNKGPFVRFAWGFSTDDCLNHHPESPSGTETKAWYGRKFDPDNPNLFIRTERQALQGLKPEGLLLFTIKTYFYSVANLNQAHKHALLKALNSMNRDSLQYKGLTESKTGISHWLLQQLSS